MAPAAVKPLEKHMTKNLRRLAAVVATAILAVGVLGTAPANADTTWGGQARAHHSTE